MSDSICESPSGNELFAPERGSNIDVREQLFNDGATGPIVDVQVSTVRIAQLNGILFDVDPKLIVPGPMIPDVPQKPREFYDVVIQPMLQRHGVLQRAEVRNSGTGLHVILRFAEPVVFNTDPKRDRWIGIIQVVQCALPIDPDQPHITAVTRPIGSVNSKNNATVGMLTPGLPVTQQDVMRLYEEMRTSPFKTVLKIVTGLENVEPCPICRKPGTELSALDFVGQCYGSCGQVHLETLYDTVLAPRSQGVEEGVHSDASKP